jgi:hypothetical protein
MTDWQAILLTVAGTIAGLLGGGVTPGYFSRRYYLKSGPDLDTAFRPLYELNRGFCSRFSNPFLDDAL